MLEKKFSLYTLTVFIIISNEILKRGTDIL